MNRGFRSVHPFVLFVYFVAVITGLMTSQHPIFLLSGCIIILVANLILDKGEELIKWVYMIVFISIFVSLFTPIFNQQGRIVLFEIFNRTFYLEAVIQGFLIALTLTGILALFTIYNIVMTSDKFFYLFSGWFPKWSLIIMLALRFIPLFRHRLLDIQEVQETKGVSMKDGSVLIKARNGMLFIQILLTYSLEEAIQTADSMTARGYGLQKRSRYENFTWKKRDTFLLLLLFSLSGTILIGWQSGSTVLQLYPTLESLSLNGNGLLYLISWIILIGLPIWIEGKEVIRWKYLKQEI